MSEREEGRASIKIVKGMQRDRYSVQIHLQKDFCNPLLVGPSRR